VPSAEHFWAGAWAYGCFGKQGIPHVKKNLERREKRMLIKILCLAAGIWLMSGGRVY